MHLNNLINKKTEIMESIHNRVAGMIAEKFGLIVEKNKNDNENTLSQSESDELWEKIYNNNPDISGDEADKKYEEEYKKAIEAKKTSKEETVKQENKKDDSREKSTLLGPLSDDEKRYQKEEEKRKREEEKEENGGKEKPIELPKSPKIGDLTMVMIDFLKRKREGKSLEKESLKEPPVKKLRNASSYTDLVDKKESSERNAIKTAGNLMKQAENDRRDAADATETYDKQAEEIAKELVKAGKYNSIQKAINAVKLSTKDAVSNYTKKKHNDANNNEKKASETTVSGYDDRDHNYTATYGGIPDFTEEGGYFSKNGKYVHTNFSGYEGEESGKKAPYIQHQERVNNAWNTRQKRQGGKNTIAQIKKGVVDGNYKENNPPEDFMGSHAEWNQLVDTAKTQIKNSKIKKDKAIASDLENKTGVKQQSREHLQDTLDAYKQRQNQIQKQHRRQILDTSEKDENNKNIAHKAPSRRTPDKVIYTFGNQSQKEKETKKHDDDDDDVIATFGKNDVPWNQGDSTENIVKNIAKTQNEPVKVEKVKSEFEKLGRPAKTNPTRNVNLPESIIYNTKIILSKMLRESFNLYDMLPKNLKDELENIQGVSDKKAFVRSLKQSGDDVVQKLRNNDNSIQGIFDRDISDAHQTDSTRRGLEVHTDNAEKSSHKPNKKTFNLGWIASKQYWRNNHKPAENLSNYEGEQVSGRKNGKELDKSASEAGRKILRNNYFLDKDAIKRNERRDKERTQKIKTEQINHEEPIIENREDPKIQVWVSGKGTVGSNIKAPFIKNPEDMASNSGNDGLNYGNFSDDESEEIQKSFNNAFNASKGYNQKQKKPVSIIPKALKISDNDSPEVKQKKQETTQKILSREKEKNNKRESDNRVKRVLDNLTNDPSITGKQKKEYARRAYTKFPELFKQELSGHNILDSQKESQNRAKKKKINWGKRDNSYKEQVPHTPEIGKNLELPNKSKGAKPSTFWKPTGKIDTHYLNVDKLLSKFERDNPTTTLGEKIKQATKNKK